MRTSAIARSALVTGIWNNFVKLGMPVIALALLALESEITPARLSAAVIGLAVLFGAILVFGLILKSERLARSIGAGLGRVVSTLRGLFRKEPVVGWDDRAAGFRADTIGLLQHRWISLTLATIVSHLSLYAVLLVTIRHVGVGQEDLSWIQVLAAFSFVRLISALPVTPGGVGVVELGYAAAMTIGMDDLMSSQVVAAILVFRVITYALPIPLGAASYVIWRRNRTTTIKIHCDPPVGVLPNTLFDVIKPMIERFPLQEAARAYERMQSGEARFRCVLETGA